MDKWKKIVRQDRMPLASVPPLQGTQTYRLNDTKMTPTVLQQETLRYLAERPADITGQ
jgi:hypothetical protein